MSHVIKNGTVLDRRGEQQMDVRVERGVVVEVGVNLAADRTLDATDCIVSPGFVDLHVHLREPGREEAETVETGSRAAARGGFTAVVAMPNTEPPHDTLYGCRVHRHQATQAVLRGLPEFHQAQQCGKLRRRQAVFTGTDLELRDVALMRAAQQVAHGLVQAVPRLVSQRSNLSHLA